MDFFTLDSHLWRLFYAHYTCKFYHSNPVAVTFLENFKFWKVVLLLVTALWLTAIVFYTTALLNKCAFVDFTIVIT